MKSKRFVQKELTRRIIYLLRDNRRLTGFQICRRLCERAEQKKFFSDQGSIYMVLHRLEARGWLGCEYRLVEERWRKYYFLIAQPEAAADTPAATLLALVRGRQPAPGRVTDAPDRRQLKFYSYSQYTVY